MAGDWIKMRTVLQTCPKVVRISSALDADRLRTVGGLHAVWSLFDAHSEDGLLAGYTPEVLDQMIGWPGFAKAMEAVGWIIITPEALELPEFDSHNGQSAKRRAQEADRKRRVRTSAKESAPEADKKRTREEKRREENNKGRFTPPTVQEVSDYCQERGNGIDAESFVDFYTGTNWFRGKTKIKDWKSCVRTWEKNHSGGTPDRQAEYMPSL